jgi:cation:H+ antiporter
MIMATTAVIGGLLLLIWSADRFIEGAAAIAHHAGLPPLLIGMVIVGFGTSAPELAVSALSAMQGNPGLALGNAYGSNIANIALILGAAALAGPIVLRSQILKRELPILAVVTLLAIAQLPDGLLSRPDAWLLLAVFAALMSWSVYEGMRHKRDLFATEMDAELKSHPMSLPTAIAWLLAGLLLLIASSRLLVWGAVEIAVAAGVSDVLIGLTVVAIGTSLPEMAACMAAARKNEPDLAIGNVIGSNLFNTLAVTGLAAAIHPIAVAPEILYRDAGFMLLLTLSLFLFGRINGGTLQRSSGMVLLAAYAGWMIWVVADALA